MKNHGVFLMGLCLWMGSTGCFAETKEPAGTLQAQGSVPAAVAQQPETSAQAISFAETLKTIQAKKDYLMQQAQMFYQSKQFQYCMDVAQHVLANIDGNSGDAKDLLNKAKEQLVSTATEKVGTVKNSLLNSFGSQEKK